MRREERKYREFKIIVTAITFNLSNASIHGQAPRLISELSILAVLHELEGLVLDELATLLFDDRQSVHGEQLTRFLLPTPGPLFVATVSVSISVVPIIIISTSRA